VAPEEGEDGGATGAAAELLVGGGEEVTGLAIDAGGDAEGEGDGHELGPIVEVAPFDFLGDAAGDEAADGEVGAGQDEAEVVAADAGGEVAAADAVDDGGGSAAEHVVADVMAVGLVDEPRADEVDENEGHGLARFGGGAALVAEAFVEGVAVVEASEVVGAGFAFEPADHGVAAAEAAVLFDGGDEAEGELGLVEVAEAEEVVGSELERGDCLELELVVEEEDDGDVGPALTEVADDGGLRVEPEPGADEGDVEGAIVEEPLRLADAAGCVRDEAGRVIEQLSERAHVADVLVDDEDAEGAAAGGRGADSGDHAEVPNLSIGRDSTEDEARRGMVRGGPQGKRTGGLLEVATGDQGWTANSSATNAT
jgi:hypothetical protein